MAKASAVARTLLTIRQRDLVAAYRAYVDEEPPRPLNTPQLAALIDALDAWMAALTIARQ